MEKEGRYIPSFVLDFPLRDPGNRMMKIIRPFLKAGMTVLDHGAGSGFYTVKLSRAVGNGGKVVALEPNPASVRSLEKKIKRQKLTNVEIVKDSGSRMLSIPSDYFDFIFSNLVICCLADHRSAMNEIMRTLKPGSHAFISVTKETGHNDPMRVTKTEWDSMLLGTKVISEGTTPLSRWVVIEKPTYDL
ncbi:MAG TPA: class I SAM-dependent methyltransferase [Thermoplasmataceae archaeon]|nr:class I SAM-dependent methyltransferase [Thermoplasmataceae archaeon]